MKKTPSHLIERIEQLSDLLQQTAKVAATSDPPLELEHFLNVTVHHIRDQLGYYFVGLFSLDDPEWFRIRAGTGEEGRLILLRTRSRGRVNDSSLVGWVLQNRQGLISLDVGPQAVRFQNPYLPDSRSEIALPLISEEQLIGALNVLSVEEAAFSKEDIPLFQTLADQLAKVIQEVRPFCK